MSRNNQHGVIERKDAADLSAAETKKAVGELMTAFTEFKKANDERLAEIEKKGHADPLLVAKVDKANEAVGMLEGINQQLTLQAQGAKAMQEQMDAIEAKASRILLGVGANVSEAEQKAAQYKQAFGEFLRSDPNEVKAEVRAALAEFKALVAGNDALGGYFVLPPQMQTEILKNVIEISPMRALATVTPIGSGSLKLPKRTGTFAARRVAEVGPRSETLGYGTGMLEIPAAEMFAEVHISEQMLEDQAYDMEAEMRLEFAEQFALLEGTEFISGTGAGNQAEGILTNGDVGTTVSGDATKITADGVLGLYFDVKTAHTNGAVYVLNRQSLRAVRLLKDTTNQYLWTPGLANGTPNTINGVPYVEMPAMPDQGANAYPVAFGNFRRAYRVVDRILLSVLRDPYTQSGNGKIRYLARKRTGGGVVLPEAIRKLKCSV